MNKILKILVLILLIVFLGFCGLIGLGFYRNGQKDKTDVAIARINSTKITLDDVMGKYLPKEPDQKQNDATVEGIDANNNYIRDDVELAIFKKYPNSAKIRAAELQYAQALQLELTQVFNSETFISALKKEDSASLCIGETVPSSDLKTALSLNTERKNEVVNIVLNNSVRKDVHSFNLKKYLTTYSSDTSLRCDINLSSLPN